METHTLPRFPLAELFLDQLELSPVFFTGYWYEGIAGTLADGTGSPQGLRDAVRWVYDEVYGTTEEE